jgi:putative NADH-flavin reductase
MNLTIFGSTGKTGIHLVCKALEADYIVTAFARSPEKITLSHPNLTVVEGNTLDRDAVADAVKGADAVISLIGVNPKSEEFTFYKSISNVLNGMKQHSVKRLVMSAGAGVGDPNDKAGIMGKLLGGIIKLIARNAYEDGIKTANLVRSISENRLDHG